MDDLHGVDAEVLQAQLQARNVMKREVKFFLAAFAAATLWYFLFSFPSLIGLVVYGAIIAGLRTAMVWYQWRFLIRFALTCPYCKKPLGTGVHYFKSPTHDCPHCGRQAMAPIRQLVEFEKSQSSRT